MAENEWGHAVVATALAVVDDTSLTSKAIVGDIKVCRFVDILCALHAVTLVCMACVCIKA